MAGLSYNEQNAAPQIKEITELYQLCLKFKRRLAET